MTTQHFTGAREEERQLGATYESVCAAAPAVIAEALGEAPEPLDPGLWSVTTKSTRHEISLGRVGPDCRLVVKTTPVVSSKATLIALAVATFAMLLGVILVNEHALPPVMLYVALAVAGGAMVQSVRQNLRDQRAALRARDVLTHRLLRAFEDTFREAPVGTYRVAPPGAGAALPLPGPRVASDTAAGEPRAESESEPSVPTSEEERDAPASSKARRDAS